MPSSSSSTCSACGLAQRKTSDGTLKPLKRCSRCKQAWYHDGVCQRNHFPLHKKGCKRLAAAAAAAAAPTAKGLATTTKITTINEDEMNPKNKNTPNLLRIERRAARGNTLVASVAIPKGHRIVDSNASPLKENDNGGWNPLVAPALHGDYRSTRCACCFGSLSSSTCFYRFDDIVPRPRPQYLLLFCSTSCRQVARERFGMDEEERAISVIYTSEQQQQRRGPPKIFSTAILTYRLIIATQRDDVRSRELCEKLGKLQHDHPHHHNVANDDNETAAESSKYHSQAVIATVSAMIQHTKGGAASKFTSFPPLEYVESIVNRIKINGFAICDGESVAMGVGIFGTPSFMNHSCRPNTIQTFSYGIPCQTPQLILTTHESIRPNQEICISYIDNASPRHVRRTQLRDGYFFHCTCEACSDLQLESKLLGLKCMNCSSSEPAIPVETEGPDATTIYKCPTCSNNDFQAQLEAMLSPTNNDETFKSSSSLSLPSTSSLPVDSLEQEYSKRKKLFLPGSWYLQESGERLAQCYLDALSSATSRDDPMGQQKAALRARAIFEELLTAVASSSSSTTTSSGTFRQHMNIYKAAKLDLFLMMSSNPAVAMDRIQSVRRFYSPYFPPNHELLQGLDDCLKGGMG